ncbi:hypothetical protein V6N12_066689 [Hibiscus sabdariffa]|uniref:Uncharacterized protein n=1 Tax=Hibiscus sabdariffa TaxID=183260 RepID=A0ABR2BDG3_9ROSI
MSLFEVTHMIESLGIKNAVKVFRVLPNGPFKVLPFTDDNDVLNMVVELPRNRNVHLYLVEQDHAFVSEPNDEHEPQTNDVPGPVVSDSEFGTEPNIETNVESGTGLTDEPIGRDIDFGSEPNVESNAEFGTDPNDEPVVSDIESGSEPNDEHVDSDTECESGFEEDEFSADEDDDNETESVVHTPQFTEHASQFETHFEEARVVLYRSSAPCSTDGQPGQDRVLSHDAAATFIWSSKVKRRFCGTTKECATTTTAPTQEAPQVQQPSAIQVVGWMIGSQESSISHCTPNVATSTRNDQ